MHNRFFALRKDDATVAIFLAAIAFIEPAAVRADTATTAVAQVSTGEQEGRTPRRSGVVSSPSNSGL